MDRKVAALLADRDSGDRDAAYQALVTLFRMTEEPVDWAYQVWDQLVADLAHRDGHKRAFSAQLLCRLAVSDPEERILQDFPKLESVLRDEKPVTARHTLQSLWRVGLGGAEQRAMVMTALEKRFRQCEGEKGATVVRTDVVTALGRLYKSTHDEAVEARVNALIESEPEEKFRKKQQAAWRKAIK